MAGNQLIDRDPGGQAVLPLYLQQTQDQHNRQISSEEYSVNVF